MRCRQCDYPLWNLTTRNCPECGQPFRPGEFDFRPSSVKFCCPSCDQAYYGTTAEGHLEPATFQCVSCGRALSMDEMVLRPADGLLESQTRRASNPWLERERIGFLRAWMRTIGHSMVAPGRIMEGTAVGSSLGQAWWFLLFTVGVTLAVSFVPALCLSVPIGFLGAGGGGPGPGTFAAIMAGGTVMGLGIGLVFLMIYVPVWILISHGLLHLTGGQLQTLRRTTQAICYSGGTFVVSLVPCLGNAATIWWMISAILMVKEGHRVSGVRASFAVITFPAACMLLLAGLYATLLFVGFSAGMASAGTAGTATSEVRVFTTAIREHARQHQGRGPGHATQLIASGAVSEWDFVSIETATDTSDVLLGDRTLFQISMLPADDQAVYFDEAAAALPDDAAAHRVGDFVFTYHGVDLANPAPELWIVVLWPEAPEQVDPLHVGRADGTVRRIPAASAAAELVEQNALRELHGLPPLPDPGTI